MEKKEEAAKDSNLVFHPIHKYVLGYLENDGTGKPIANVLVKDGVPCNCHKVSPIVAMNAITNAPDLKYEYCNTRCSRAILAGNENGDMMFIQTCEAQPGKYPLQKGPEKAEKTSTLQIVKK